MSNQVAVVTGAARGLGKAFTEALLQRGYKVFFCDIDVEVGEQTENDLAKSYGKEKVRFQKCDVRNEEDFTGFFENVLKEWYSVDLMVNNAGIMHEKNWRRCIDINLNGVIQGSMLAIEHMKTSNGGKGGIIINISSLAGVVPVLFSPVYSATKSAIIHFSRSWAMNPMAAGIRIACLCPAFADTDIIKNTTTDHFQGQEYFGATVQKLGIMLPDRVTEAFLKLVDDEDNNGKAYVVTANMMTYVDFPNPLIPKPEKTEKPET